MKILCIHQGYELYGSDRSFLLSLTLIKELFPKAEITVIIPREGPLFDELIKIANHVIVEHIGSVSKNDLKKPISTFINVFRGIFKAIKQSRKFDFIYINTVVIISYILAQRFVNAPSIVHVREIPTGIGRFFFSLVLRVGKSSKIYNSANTQSSYFFRSKRREKVILNSVSEIIADPLPDRPLTNFLLIGRISEWKGQKFFVKVLSKLSQEELKYVSVRIVGAPPSGRSFLLRDLEHYIEVLNLSTTVRLFPFLDDPTSHFDWASVVVVPSQKPEPFGRVAIEAMSCGRPVIAAAHGGLLEIVKDNTTGWFFEPNNAESFLACIREVIGLNFEKLRTISERAKEDFQDRFVLKRYKEEFCQYVSFVCNENLGSDGDASC
ncbi:glycosyltransferase family 4 protein [Parapedobacter sp. 2B3]|uniref:glycosyltransferase family 4 protein n=1 Tax=Parapedobacter sp. 2B3 TaxID=3342381 RepID=UPI0035B571F5